MLIAQKQNQETITRNKRYFKKIPISLKKNQQVDKDLQSNCTTKQFDDKDME